MKDTIWPKSSFYTTAKDAGGGSKAGRQGGEEDARVSPPIKMEKCK